MTPLLDGPMPVWKWRIVLARPRNPLNIGAAARAMVNFGFRELVVVAPYPPTWQEASSAVGADDVMKSARALDSLVEGIGAAALVLGTTCGSRRNLDRGLISLRDLPAWLDKRRRDGQKRPAGRHALGAALLFGSEKTGLSNEEMSFCHGLVRIPTEPECPSMNLGQAVAVCCYELARAGAVGIAPARARIHLSDPANMQSLDHVFERAARVLGDVGYLKPKSRQATLAKLRRLLLDLDLTQSDAKIVGGILAQIEWKLKTLAH